MTRQDPSLFEVDHVCSKCKKHEIKSFYYQEVKDIRYPIYEKVWYCKYCQARQVITNESVKILKTLAWRYEERGKVKV